MGSKKLVKIDQKALRDLHELEDSMVVVLERLSDYERDLAKSGFSGELLRSGPLRVRETIYAMRHKVDSLKRYWNDGK